jgi:hypothetical protein
MALAMKKPLLFGCVLIGLLGITVYRAEAAQSQISQFDQDDYNTVTSTYPWSQAPSNHHRLYLDIYNVTDFFDSETGDVAGFTDQTLLADTVRPTATLLWDDRYRIQLGLIAEKVYGASEGFRAVNPWIQLLWKPIQPLSVILGDLDTPHYFLPALFYPTNYFMPNMGLTMNPNLPQTQTVPSNYFTNSPVETGAQVILQKPYLYDDLYFNYRDLDTAAHNEKFDLAFVHRNTWKWFYLNYQMHWVHYGGELFPHPIDTRNDTAQAFGLGLQFHPYQSLMYGISFNRLHSHLRQDSDTPGYLIPSTAGNGTLCQAWARYGRVKLIFGDWRGHNFYHEGGDPMFTLPNVDLATLRWDIILSRDFNLYLENTEYFIGNNDLGYNHFMKTALLLQGSWQFSIPIMEWTTPAPSPEGVPVPTRWDYGL